MPLHAQTSFVGEFCGERLVYRENRYRDGTTYALTVFTGDDGFYGVFTCPNCERTELSALDHLPGVTELRRWKELELNLALGALIDQCGHLLKAAMPRLQRGFKMTDLGGVLRGTLRPDGPAACEQACTGHNQKIAS